MGAGKMKPRLDTDEHRNLQSLELTPQDEGGGPQEIYGAADNSEPVLIMEMVTHFDINFSRVAEVEAAEGPAVIQQQTAVRPIQSADGDRKVLAEVLPKGQVKGCVSGQPVQRTATSGALGNPRAIAI